jgi:soluble lytic murein transglycosylase
MRLAQKIGMGQVGPLELQEPPTAIELGAVYLAELQTRTGGQIPAMVASYNAGEAQADLWQLHCFTEDPAEYLTKVGFTETRNYVDRVLRGHATYRELYQPPRERRLAAR